MRFPCALELQKTHKDLRVAFPGINDFWCRRLKTKVVSEVFVRPLEIAH